MEKQLPNFESEFLASYAEFVNRQAVDRMLREGLMDPERIARLSGTTTNYVRNRRRELNGAWLLELANRLPGLFPWAVLVLVILAGTVVYFIKNA